MTGAWVQIRVELVGGMGAELESPPGRVLAASPSTSLARLAHAIDVAFGRWDLSHLHEFELADGRRVGVADPEDPDVLDHAATLESMVDPGDRFEYVFDLGDDWRHRCEVLEERLDPQEEFGELLPEPVVVWGWGWLPDQYGRETEEDLE